jgi:hypothetical protein
MDNKLSINVADEEILNLVRQWCSFLAEEQYQKAYDLCSHPPDEHWSSTLIETVISNYGSVEPRRDGKRFKVTSLETATGNLIPTHEVDRFENPTRADDVIGIIWFDLPLNGEWSDLTATFDIKKLGDNLVLVLDDIHVM